MTWVLVGLLAFVVFIIILITNGSGSGDWEGALKKAIQGERQQIQKQTAQLERTVKAEEEQVQALIVEVNFIKG